MHLVWLDQCLDLDLVRLPVTTCKLARVDITSRTGPKVAAISDAKTAREEPFRRTGIARAVLSVVRDGRVVVRGESLSL